MILPLGMCCLAIWPLWPEELVAKSILWQFQMGVESQSNASLAKSHFRAAEQQAEFLWLRGQQTLALCQYSVQASALVDDIPLALWKAHQGLQLYPYDQQLQQMQAKLRAQVVYPNDPVWRERLQPSDDWQWQRYVSPSETRLFLSVILAVCSAWICQSRSMNVILGRVSLLILVGVIVYFWFDPANREATDPVRVIRELTPLRSGNSESYANVIAVSLPSGLEVKVIAERGSWAKIRLADGTTGWVQERCFVSRRNPP